MKTLTNKIIKPIIAALFFFTFSTSVALGQISYNDEEIILPDAEFTPARAGDIIEADNFIYVYTMKNILIYKTEISTTTYKGKIDFGVEHGRFAPMFFSSPYYAADPVAMAHDPVSHTLYFVTPELDIKSVSTLSLDTEPEDVDLPLNIGSVVNNRTLHAYTKLVYDNDKHRLFWLFRSMDNNLHSFDAYFGVFEQDDDGEWTSIHQESQEGSDGVGSNYENLISTFTINTNNSNTTTRNDFYMCRKFKIEQWRISQGTASKITTVATPGQERNSKMIFIGEKNLLLVFPLQIPNTETIPTDDYIYQINTITFNFDNDDLELAPSTKILDAVYVPENNDILVCYGNNSNKQIETNSDHDVACYHYNNAPDKQIFTFNQIINTNDVDEIDILETNLNRPFKLTKKANGQIIVSKKNSIILLSKPGSSEIYSWSTIHYARDNFFGKGTVDADGNTFIVNMAKSGFEKINANNSSQEFFRTSYPVYNSVYNDLNRKLYFFNRLATESTGFFAYDMETGNQTFVETSGAIGDLIYNRVNNQIMVSEYAPADEGNAHIIIYNADDLSLVNTLSYSGFDFPGRMFAAPNGRVYISMNMHADENFPKILVVDATTYDSYFSITSGLSSFPSQLCNTFQSFFCYNPYNQKVYSSFGPYKSFGDQPYQTSYNCGIETEMEPYENPLGVFGGKLIEIGEGAIDTKRFDIERPNEIICSTPISQQNNKDYKGVLFVNSIIDSDDTGTESDLMIFDCKTSSFIELPEGEKIHEIYDMDYCPLTGCLYALCQEVIEIDDMPDQKFIHVYKVEEDGNYTSIIQEDFEGTASSINYNEFDSKLYIYDRGKYKMLGNSNTKIHTVDPFAESNAITHSIYLPYKNMYPEIVPQANHPHFDPYNNKAYFPNGTHSSVSVVEFTPSEYLSLYPGYNWVSIPRHEGNLGQQENEYWPTPQVLAADNFNENVAELELQYYKIDPDFLTSQYVYANYDESQGTPWSYNPTPDNEQIYSARGYKLEYLPNEENNFLHMTGNIEAPETDIQLYENNMNWVGYFIPQAQDAFDALHWTVLGDLIEIWTDNFYCYKSNGIIQDGPSHGEVESTYWVCDKTDRTLNYGDLVVLTSLETRTFQWENTLATKREELRPETEYFQFQETADYTPIIIELDYQNNPLELGAFIDTTCVGAVALMPEDTAVILKAYLDGSVVEDVVFQEYYGTKSSLNNIVSEYGVFNNKTNRFEHRMLKSNIGSKQTYISFKNKGKSLDNMNGGFFDFWPNPAKNKISYNLTTTEKSIVSVLLFDVNGKQISVLLNRLVPQGQSRGTISLNSSSGKKLNPGIYFIKYKIRNEINIEKLIVQ